MEIFPYIQRMKKEKPYQLFCFPHAGGNSLTFAKWVDRSSKIDIIPISLSERGIIKVAEKLNKRLENLVEV